MVTQTIDTVRVPTINLSAQELADMEELIAAGQLPKDFIDRHFEAVEKNVFGHDCKFDKHGNPIEQGLGSPGNQTRNSVEAYRRFCKQEPNYAENLKRMEAELVKCEEKRKASVTASNRKRQRRIAG